MNSHDDAAAARQLLDLINGSWIAQACYVIARLGIADLLAAGPRTAEDLAARDRYERCGAAPPAQRAGERRYLPQRADGAFEMTRLGSLLRADVPCSMRAWALQWGGEAWQVWANLLTASRQGTAHARWSLAIRDSLTWSAIRRLPQIFNQAMVDLTRLAALDIARAYDFAGQRVMDVGGGYGELLAHILSTYPTAQGVLFDMPHAIAKAREHLDGRGLAGRCEFIAGDFLRQRARRMRTSMF